MTGQIYRDVILEQHVRLFRGAMGAEFLFMDDNARPHHANIVDECLQSEDITRMDWPAYSPDLNPIEHVWDMLDRRIAARQYSPTCLPELRRALLGMKINKPTPSCQLYLHQQLKYDHRKVIRRHLRASISAQGRYLTLSVRRYRRTMASQFSGDFAVVWGRRNFWQTVYSCLYTRRLVLCVPLTPPAGKPEYWGAENISPGHLKNGGVFFSMMSRNVRDKVVLVESLPGESK
ncbi:transposable element Tcb1 transposase [Trichonephila clavipes]|nr:transposable element Tcb1 transposase [Trichonephila clavipes]